MTSGIYSLVDSICRRYVGSSRNIESRISNHMKSFNSGSHPNKMLQSAYDFGGLETEVLESCAFDLLESREQYFIDRMNPKFNVLRRVGRSDSFEPVENTSENHIHEFNWRDHEGQWLWLDIPRKSYSRVSVWLKRKGELAGESVVFMVLSSPTLRRNLIKCPFNIRLKIHEGEIAFTGTNAFKVCISPKMALHPLTKALNSAHT